LAEDLPNHKSHIYHTLTVTLQAKNKWLIFSSFVPHKTHRPFSNLYPFFCKLSQVVTLPIITHQEKNWVEGKTLVFQNSSKHKST